MSNAHAVARYALSVAQAAARAVAADGPGVWFFRPFVGSFRRRLVVQGPPLPRK